MARPIVVRGSGAFPQNLGRPVVTIGNFDGVHAGHRGLIQAARAMAPSDEVPVCVYTFDPPPRDVMAPGNDVRAIQSLDDKARRLGEAGADIVVIETFTREFAGLSAEYFAEVILGQNLRCQGVVVGWDFRFGRGRAGDHELLRALLDVPVQRVEAVEMVGEVVSSSRIRRLIEAGDVEVAAQLLGQAHELVGQVVHGDGRGRTIGVPTANVDVATALRPAAGVYAVRVHGAGETARPGVANYGVRPTVGRGSVPLEVHLLDGSADIYGCTLRVELVQRIRGERRFRDVDALVSQIREDVRWARRILDVEV
jgi:riboflavin kinase/FMN adenylyltransferase